MASAIHSKHGILESIVTAATLAGAAAFAAVYFELFLEQVYPGGLGLWEVLLTDWVSWPVVRALLG